MTNSDVLVERLRSHGSWADLMKTADEAADTILSLKSALTRIAEAACYHTRTTGERVCPAEQTRDIARAALSGSPEG